MFSCSHPLRASPAFPIILLKNSLRSLRYTARSVAIVMAHDPATPLFLYHAWQEAHTPNEVPDEFLAPEASTARRNRDPLLLPLRLALLCYR